MFNSQIMEKTIFCGAKTNVCKILTESSNFVVRCVRFYFYEIA